MKEALAMQLCHLSLSTTLHYIGIACDILYSEHKCNKFFLQIQKKSGIFVPDKSSDALSFTSIAYAIAPKRTNKLGASEARQTVIATSAAIR